jgi:hypothetical protein
VPERAAEEEAIKRTGENVMLKLDEPLKICSLVVRERYSTVKSWEHENGD